MEAMPELVEDDVDAGAANAHHTDNTTRNLVIAVLVVLIVFVLVQWISQTIYWYRSRQWMRALLERLRRAEPAGRSRSPPQPRPPPQTSVMQPQRYAMAVQGAPMRLSSEMSPLL